MFFERDKSSGYMTNWAARLFARAIDLKLKPLGLSSAYMPVIFALAKGERLSQRALTAAAAIEQPTMAATLTRMLRDGLVVKQPDPKDGRSVLYALSERGLALTKDVRNAGRSVNDAAFEGLSEAEQARFMAMLGKVVDNLEQLVARSR